MQAQWPTLSFSEARATYETVHLWTQIVGKIKLGKLPWINHSWHVTLLVSPTGLTTGDIMDSDQHFQIDFNFLEHQLHVICSSGQTRTFGLQDISVATFYKKIRSALDELKLQVKINPIPCELENIIPFDQDETHATYNPTHAVNMHKALLNAHDVFTQFRAEFNGKCSPVHFFWGSFDLAVSRFSGREAPPHPGGIPNLPDWVAREAYSHEVCSCGFWPGNEAVPFAAFYSYLYPEPEGYMNASVLPEQAYYHRNLREFVLPYEVVQQSQDPTQTLLSFLRSTYAAGADLAAWNRKALEKTT
jgi:hypothetical protein